MVGFIYYCVVITWMNSKVRTIYLYIFAMLGLVLLVIGGVGFVDMALKAFVFTSADEEQRVWARQPPQPYALRIDAISESDELSEEDRAAIRSWLDNYREWEETSARIDPVRSSRERSAARNLAFIIIGLPLYLYHWNTIKRETKK